MIDSVLDFVRASLANLSPETKEKLKAFLGFWDYLNDAGKLAAANSLVEQLKKALEDDAPGH